MTGSQDEDRRFITKLFERLAEVSADSVGFTRASYGAGENAAHEVIAAAASGEGLEVSRDAAANLVICLPGTDPDAPFVACGSHLDSVPRGGNFDGAAGVLAGLHVLRSLHREGNVPARDIRLYALRGEESAWYGKCYLGSNALFGKLDAVDLERRRRDGAGSLAEAMTACGAAINRIHRGEILLEPDRVAAYLELHIEQGPVLERTASPAGIVTAIRGNTRYVDAHVKGEAAHSGTTPMEYRKDAVLAFSDFAGRLERHCAALVEAGIDVVINVGVCSTDPDHHALSRVPDRVDFSLEFRSTSSEVLARFDQFVRKTLQSVGRERGVRFELGPAIETPPATMDERIIENLERAGRERKIKSPLLPSGAGHDAAVFAAQGIAAGMIFVRNQHGSHNPNEAMRYDDFFAATGLLCSAVLSEANRPVRGPLTAGRGPISVRPKARRLRVVGDPS